MTIIEEIYLRSKQYNKLNGGNYRISVEKATGGYYLTVYKMNPNKEWKQILFGRRIKDTDILKEVAESWEL